MFHQHKYQIMRIILFLLLTSVIFYSCQNSSKLEPVEEEKIEFKGIFEMDERGVPVSDRDSDDWNFTDTWVQQEISLFNRNLRTDCTLPEMYGIIGYPNPTFNIVNLHVNKPDSVRMAIRIVDRNFKVLMSKDSLYAVKNAIDLSQFNIKDTVRVYYKFINGNCEFRGHGDLVIE